MSSPRTIVFITTDTQGRDMVSAYGPAHWHGPAAPGGGGTAGVQPASAASA